MGESSTLKVTSMFKLKSPDKERSKFKLLGSLRRGASASPKEEPESCPGSPDPVSPGDSAAVDADVSPLSPKVKKVKRLLSWRLKSKKSKCKEQGEGPEFNPETDELDSFSSYR